MAVLSGGGCWGCVMMGGMDKVRGHRFTQPTRVAGVSTRVYGVRISR